MKYLIKHPALLKKILWVDFAGGFIFGVFGIIFYAPLAEFLGFPAQFTLGVCVVNLAYSLVSLRLVIMPKTSIPLLLGLIAANWTWTLASFGFIYLHFTSATFYGQAFLILNILLVGGLAFAEGRQLERVGG